MKKRSARPRVAAIALLVAAPAAAQGVSWRYVRPTNTGIQGDWSEALWVAPDGNPWIAAYNPFFEEGGFAEYVRADDRWVNYSNVDYPIIADSSQVGTARIHDIEEDAAGALWMGTWRGALYFDPAVGPASLARYDETNSAHPGGRTTDVDVAPDGTVWFAVYSGVAGSGGLVRHDPAAGTWTFWGSGTTANGWPQTGICEAVGVQPEPGGGYVVWTEGLTSIIAFDSATQTFTEYPFSTEPGTIDSLPTNECVDDAGNLWAWRTPPGGGLSSILEYRRPDGTWVTPPQVSNGSLALTAYGDGEALLVDGSSRTWRYDGQAWADLGQWLGGGSVWTYDVDQDAAGNVWACGSGGAAVRDAATGAWQRYRVTNTAMLDFWTRDFAFDDAGNVWMTGNAGPGVGGMQRWDGTRWFNFNDFTYGLGGPWGFPTDNADAIAARAGGAGVVLNPMFNGLYEWDGAQFTDLFGVSQCDGLVVDSLDRVWAINNYFDLRFHDGQQWTTVPIAGWGSNVQRDPDQPGMVWAAANLEVVRSDGTYYFSRQNVDFPELNPVSDVLTTVAAAPGGVAWVGSTDGLFRLDSNTGTHQWFHPTNSAIPGDQIAPLAVSPDGRVWFTNFGSNWPDRGLGWFDGTSFGYYPEDPAGLPHAQIVDMEVRSVPNGYEVWMSCLSRGIAILTVSEGPVVYCTAKTSSAGCVTAVGTGDLLAQPVSGAADYSVTASAVQGGKNGILFGGIAGPAALPFSGGTLCVQPPTKRGPIQASGGTGPATCDGAFALVVNDGAVVPLGLDAGPGNTGWYQWWYRDPQNGAGQLGTALSNAVELDFQ